MGHIYAVLKGHRLRWRVRAAEEGEGAANQSTYQATPYLGK